MNTDDRAMTLIGLIAAVLGFLSPIYARFTPLSLAIILHVCLSIALVMCTAVLVRGAFTKRPGRPRH